MSEGSRESKHPRELEWRTPKPVEPFPPLDPDQKLPLGERFARWGQERVDREKGSHTRRNVVAGGLATIGAGFLGIKRHNNEAPSVEAEQPAEQLHNDIIYVARDPETEELSFSDVAQYKDAAFIGAETPENPGQIYVRSEHRVSNDEDKVQILNESEINGQDIGVIRVAGIGAEDSNQTHDNPQYCFKTSIRGNLEFAYLWLALAKKTGNPDDPYIYVDGHGNESETPWFVGPNFVDTTIKQSSDNDDQ